MIRSKALFDGTMKMLCSNHMGLYILIKLYVSLFISLHQRVCFNLTGSADHLQHLVLEPCRLMLWRSHFVSQPPLRPQPPAA